MRAPLSHRPRVAYLLFLPNLSPSSQTPTSRSCVRRRTRCARVRQKLPRPLASRFFLARARARERRRVFSRLACPLIQEPRTPRFEQRVRPPWPPRARALSRVELTSPRSSTPSRRRGRSRELRLRAHGIPGTRFPPTPFSNLARLPKTNQPRRRGRVASRRFPRRARATRGRAGADARDRVARNPPYLSRHLFERHLTDSGRLSSRRAPHASASTRPTRRCPGAARRASFTARAPPWRCWARARTTPRWGGAGTGAPPRWRRWKAKT